MDSGSDVPTLSPGLRETVAAKLLTMARERWGGAAGAGLLSSSRGAGAATAESMLLRKARFLAVAKAGRSNAAMIAMMTMTTSSSISVNPRRGILIRHLVALFQLNQQHFSGQSIFRAARLTLETPGSE